MTAPCTRQESCGVEYCTSCNIDFTAAIVCPKGGVVAKVDVMSDTELAALVDGARKATPGDWRTDKYFGYVWGPEGEMIADRVPIVRGRGTAGRLPTADNMRHVAAASPAAIARLAARDAAHLAEIARLREEVARLKAEVKRLREAFQAPEWWCDAEETQCGHPDVEDLWANGSVRGGVVEVLGFCQTRRHWGIQVVTKRDENGDTDFDETEVLLFDSEAEARAALAETGA